MTMNGFRSVFTAAMLAVAMAASAVPAKQIERVMAQPDGTTVTLRLVGDEFCHFYVTDDDQMVLRSDDGTFCFADLNENGDLRPSKVIASNSSQRTAKQRSFLNGLDRTKLRTVATKRGIESRQIRSKQFVAGNPASKTSAKVAAKVGPTTNLSSKVGTFSGTNFKNTGSPHVCIVLVEYQDVKFNTSYDVSAKDYFTKMLTERNFSQSNGTGSAYDYFYDASKGKFTPQFDVYGPITLANNMAYYGANDDDGNDMHPADMALEACRQLNSTVDFSQYDVDGDGYIDNVFVIYAGQGEASYGSDDSVWPHAWSVGGATGYVYDFDGVYLNNYGCTNEWTDNKPDGVGTFCHEFSHKLGLADEYDINYGSAKYLAPGPYSLMASGSYNNDGRTPPTYSVFQRNAMGWADLDIIEREVPASFSLDHMLTSNRGAMIQTSSTKEFFLLENRQLSGWDAYLPGHGLLIWHIDYDATTWNGNGPNTNASHQRIDIEEAGGSADNRYTSTMAKYPFPGTAKKTSFTDTTSPNMKTWSGTALNTPITNIQESNGVITFDVCGGTPSVMPPTANLPEEGTYNNPVTLTLTPNNSADEIHYEIVYMDTDETASGIYSTPLVIADNAGVDVWSVRDGETSQTATFYFSFVTATPTLTDGGSFIELPAVTISTITTGATIYYTLDGSEPTTSSAIYTGPLTLQCAEGESITVKAIAKRGIWETSDVATATYRRKRMEEGVGTGEFERITSLSDLEDGDRIIVTNSNGSSAMGVPSSYSGSFNCPAVSVTLSDSKIKNPSSSIWIFTLESGTSANTYYMNSEIGYACTTSTNNKMGVETSTSVNSLATIGTSGSDYTIIFTNSKNSCKNLRFNSSASLFSCYSSGQQPVNIYREIKVYSKVATPTFSPVSGSTLDSGDQVTISCDTSGAAIHYTLDGSTPTSSSALYAGPVELTVEEDAEITMKAIAIKNGAANSDIATATYSVIAPYVEPDPDEPDQPGSNSPLVSDFINYTTIGIPSADTTYKSYSNKTFVSDAAYSIQCASEHSTVQLRSKNNNSGIVSTSSGGTARLVRLTWNSNTTSGRQVDIYGKNTPYSSPSDLYSSAGTKLGSLSNSATPNELEIEGDYAYIGLRSNNGALYLEDIEIVWELETPSFTVTPDLFNHASDRSVSLHCNIVHSKYTHVKQYHIWVVEVPQPAASGRMMADGTEKVVGSITTTTEHQNDNFGVTIPLADLTTDGNIHHVVVRAQAILSNNAKIDAPISSLDDVEGSTGETVMPVDTSKNGGTTGITDIYIDTDDTVPVYYNMQGQRIYNPGSGLYIERRGSHVTKIAR